MPDPVGWHVLGISGAVALWAATLVSVFLFGARVWRYVGTLRTARSEPRFDRLWRRTLVFGRNVLFQPRLLHEKVIGVAHLVIFWAFVVYATTFFWDLLRGLLPFLPIPYAAEVRWVEVLLVGFGALGLIAVVVAWVRRVFFAPQGLEKSWDAEVILILIAALLAFSLAGAWTRATGAAQAASWMWWAHMLTVLGFLAYLPYSKHLHLLASPFNVFFAPLQPGGMPLPSEGATRREEFTWKQLLGGFACAECGRCDRACPEVATGGALSPKSLMHEIKLAARAPRNGHALAGKAVKAEQIWGCATCGACMEQCPVFNEHVPILIEMRRHLVGRGEVDERLQAALTSLARYGNAFGVSARSRAKWTSGLDFKVADARKAPVEYLLWTGDTAAFDVRLAPATQALARLLHRAHLEFGILYEDEVNTGNDARRAGEEGLFETLVEKNGKALKKARFEWIVTPDPHAYQALKNEYPPEIGKRVLHSTELLARLLHDGRLPVRHVEREPLTYHDPCYLGRYNGIYAQPRKVLDELGAPVVEMPRNRDCSFCCGAGGGRIWMQDESAGRDRPAVVRVREAASRPGVGILAVACPKDHVMFDDAVKTASLDGRLAVKDVAELAEEATRPEERRSTDAA